MPQLSHVTASIVEYLLSIVRSRVSPLDVYTWQVKIFEALGDKRILCWVVKRPETLGTTLGVQTVATQGADCRDISASFQVNFSGILSCMAISKTTSIQIPRTLLDSVLDFCRFFPARCTRKDTGLSQKMHLGSDGSGLQTSKMCSASRLSPTPFGQQPRHHHTCGSRQWLTHTWKQKVRDRSQSASISPRLRATR